MKGQGVSVHSFPLLPRTLDGHVHQEPHLRCATNTGARARAGRPGRGQQEVSNLDFPSES